MTVQPRVSWALVATGAVVGVLGAAFAEQPGAWDDAVEGPLVTAMTLAGPLLMLVGLGNRATAFERARRSAVSRESWSARLRVVAWPFVLVGLAALTWVAGGLIGLKRIDGARCGEDECGLLSAILVIFGGILSVGLLGIGSFLFVCSLIAAGGVPLTESEPQQE